MSADPLHLVGTTVDGRYEVRAPLDGPPGALRYRVNHVHLKEAAQLVVPMWASPGTAARDEVLRAVTKAGARLLRLGARSGGLAQLRDAGRLATPHGFIGYWILELVEAPSLHELQRRGPGVARKPSAAAVVEAWDEPMRAIGLAHADGVIHGRLAEPLVHVCEGGLWQGGALKIAGWEVGALRSVGAPELDLPVDPAVRETWAPEARDSDLSQVGPWTDVWSVARLIAGSLRHGEGEVDVTPELRHVIKRAGAPAIGERYRSLALFQQALLDALPPDDPKIRPRQTMVVAHQAYVEDGSAGAFEAEAPDRSQLETVPRATGVRMAPRVRLRHTQVAEPAAPGPAPVPEGGRSPHRKGDHGWLWITLGFLLVVLGGGAVLLTMGRWT